GSTSPVGHLLQTTVGLKRLVEKAQGGGAEVVIIDTSGFVEGGAAWELKFQKIELVNARHIVALQRGQELEGMLSPHEDRKCRTLHRLKIYEGLRLKSYEQRRDYRKQKFSEYFQKAMTKGIPLGAVRLINPLNILTGEGCEGLYKRLLVGLNDDENFTLGLGVIEDMGLKELRLLTPIEGIERVKLVRLGAIRLDENWYDSRVKQG
ncbi:MAG TPA: Clp1/GlmU family protein, partial [Candidatus Tripitaka californicus]|uniref:Clp1/GlmU family protein n=1 Tax=Candidatus Tripitaka californicus TaxID=3367616 RepID=UPI004029F120